MAETEPESPINKMEKDHFVSPVKTLRRVTSLLSYQPSLASIPPDLRNDGYLGHWTLDHTWSIILGLVLAGFQAYSTVLAFQAAMKHGKPIDYDINEHQRRFSRACTLIPFVFATIMRRFCRSFALYRSQQGITMENLERFVGCQSFFTAFQT
ncbi:hypothetical protein GTA08_BOTSDO12815 [Botryosphaeria dothidea]|uniref:Uncharacterized protein n=1 Tax=Botryosphaeria dothidea TaxID=55169 RepID=A0A8H4J2U1_9PEZI|nr:hypothetical protein GTA08_BOTSDO12815 [Botryosphaeria dothidea]